MHCGLLSGDPVGKSTKTSNLRQRVTKIRLSKKSNYKQLNVQIWSPKEIQRRPRLLIKKPKCTGGVTQTCSGFDTLFATPYHQLAKHKKTCSEVKKKGVASWSPLIHEQPFNCALEADMRVANRVPPVSNMCLLLELCTSCNICILVIYMCFYLLDLFYWESSKHTHTANTIIKEKKYIR